MSAYAIRSSGLALALAAAVTVGSDQSSRQPPAEASFSGPVREVLAAGPYTYFHLGAAGDDQRWVVVADRKHRTATHLDVADCRPRRDFVSRRLARTFPLLHFCSLTTKGEL
jgi:hypothetical protein